MTTSDFEGFAQPAGDEQYNELQAEQERVEFAEPGEREWSPEAVERATTMVEALEMHPTILYQMSGAKALDMEFRPSWLRDGDDPNIEVIVREFHGTGVELDDEELEALATRVAELLRRPALNGILEAKDCGRNDAEEVSADILENMDEAMHQVVRGIVEDNPGDVSAGLVRIATHDQYARTFATTGELPPL